MKYAFAASALAAVALGQDGCAAPAPAGPTYFGVMSARSASPIHLQQWNARGGKVFIGGNTAAFCPQAQVGDACPPGNTTVFSGGDKTLSMGVLVPGGQQAYIAPDGSLSFTQAHSVAIPEGSVVDQFSYTAPANGAAFGYLNFETGFVACPTKEPSQTGYQVFGQKTDGATFGADCLGFSALASKLLDRSVKVNAS